MENEQKNQPRRKSERVMTPEEYEYFWANHHRHRLRMRWALGIIAVSSFVLALLLPAFATPLILLSLFSGIAIGWAE